MSQQPFTPGGMAGYGSDAANRARSATAAAAPPRESRATPINILIVDDEPKNLTVLESILDDASYRLVRATSADQALLALIADEFALLILDIQMPGMTGFELARTIKQRKRTAHVPIIFLTAYYNADQDVMQGYDTGAVDYLHKPLNPAVLRSKVSVFAELHRKNREWSLANSTLLAEINNRREIEGRLRELNQTLDQRVRDRTAALAENESRLRHAANAARLTYAEVDFISGDVRPADNFAAVFGSDPAAGSDTDFAVCRRRILRHVSAEDRPNVEAAFREFARGKPAGKLDYRILGADDVERWIESEWFVELSADGRPLKGFFTNLDISALKIAQEQSRANEERFRQLADSMPQMVWTVRADGYLDYYNARWCEFTGLDPESCFDIASWKPLLHPDDVKPFYESWRDSSQTGLEHRTEYRLWDRRAQRYCWHLCRTLPIRGEGSRVVKWIGTSTNIDEQKRSQEDLRYANLGLEQFAFAASHDLREPLRNVAIYSQLFRQRYGNNLEEEANMFLGVIVEGAQRITRLISGLLDYTQAANSEREPAPVVDAEKVFEQVLGGLSRTILETHAIITHDALPSSVSIGDVHLAQLLQNLIGNALKYRKDGTEPEVHVSALRQDSKWRFVVRDNGIGIEPEYQDQVFGIFKRLHADGKYSGTGIGLAICQKIVERYGGRIWVESKPGQGAAFCFTLPAAGGI